MCGLQLSEFSCLHNLKIHKYPISFSYFWIFLNFFLHFAYLLSQDPNHLVPGFTSLRLGEILNRLSTVFLTITAMILFFVTEV